MSMYPIGFYSLEKLNTTNVSNHLIYQLEIEKYNPCILYFTECGCMETEFKVWLLFLTLF